MSKEPVVTLVLGLVAAGVAVLVAFGVDITEAQTAAIGGFIVAAVGLGLWVRSRVTPTVRRRKPNDRGLSLLECLVVLLVVAVVLLITGVL